MVPTRQTNDRTFWIALSAAALLHALLIFGAYSSPPQRLGEPDGLADAISVDVLDPEALSDSAPAAAREASPEPASSNSARPTRPTPESAEPSEARPSEARPDEAAKPDKPQELALAEELPAPPRPAEPEKRKAAPSATAPSKAKPSQPLDFSLPPGAFKGPGAAGGGTSAVVRPAGITRSGENDDFGRDVVKALRKTMPAHRSIYGRVTIRFLLSANGDLVSIELVKGSGNPSLDQEVMFAARTSVFPFPPKNAPPVDRTFMVTYIYS